jgi:hypothetical protein
MNICALNGPTNIINGHATNKDTHVDVQASYQAQPDVHTINTQTISSQQVNHLHTYPFQYHRLSHGPYSFS